MASTSHGLGGEHAIVIGAGMAGLLAARVLVDHFRRVTVLDRDHLPGGIAPRAGAPQGHHVHVLITRGWQILGELFPGLPAALEAEDAPPIDWIADVDFHTPFGKAPRFDSPLRSRACTRALLETSVRRLLVTDPRVHLVDGVEVTGLVAEEGGARVRGVLVQRRGDGPLPAADDLRADLVVECSGRGSKAGEWLTALGHAAPTETVVDAKIGYSTRIYQRAADRPWKALYAMGRAPAQPRSGVIYPIEGGRWIVTLAGYGPENHPPTDDAGFTAFARALAVPDVAEAIAVATPLSKIHGYRRTENRIRHYEALRPAPRGFLVLGDAACYLNPVYGQGMTVSAIAATVLGEVLRERLPEGKIGPAFQRRLAAAARPAFLTATGDDFRWPHTEGRLPPGQKVLHRVVDKIFAAATRDPAIHLRLMKVLHLLSPSTALFHPYVLRRALLG